MAKPRTQRELAQTLLKKQGIMRLLELREAGVTAATMSRMERAGEVIRLSRGVYQLPDADLDPNHSLAEAAKRVPKGIVCLVSAQAFHGLTDQLPPKVWMAIGPKDWAPRRDGAPIAFVRFTDSLLREGFETHRIEGVPVKVFGVAKTVVDCFRHRGKVGLGFYPVFADTSEKPDTGRKECRYGQEKEVQPGVQARCCGADSTTWHELRTGGSGAGYRGQFADPLEA
jgi:predicted transcriptional regulator of viral defense system